MRLINVETMEMISLPMHISLLSENYPYAILSHTWGEEEVSFHEYHMPDKESKKGYAKIKACCLQARKDRIHWVWVDTCCIDKKDNAELSEAINSMYAWYRESAICYALLEDVPPRSPGFPENKFREARWFTRGWCLQELIAPTRVEFYAADWSELGTKWSLSAIIKEITGIPHDALCHKRPLSEFPAAERMSWASKRKTTRIEDMAYCLLGIFDVNMPLIYGEGERSFARLQLEILKEKEDYTVLLCNSSAMRSGSNIALGGHAIASSPTFFERLAFTTVSGESCNYNKLETLKALQTRLTKDMTVQMMARNPPHMTSQGLRMQLFTWRAPHLNDKTILVWTETIWNQQLVCVSLARSRENPLTTYLRDSFHGVHLVGTENLRSFYFKRLQLGTSHKEILGMPPHSLWYPQRPKAVELVLSSTCSSRFSFIRSLPPLDISSIDNNGPLKRLCFKPWTTAAAPGLDSSVLQLLVQLSHDTAGKYPLCDLITTIFIHPQEPKCVIKPYTHSTSGSEDSSSQATDFAALEISNSCHVTGSVKVRLQSGIAPNSSFVPDLVILNMTVYGSN
ncbi:hypothetical protein QWA68_016853 [Fusarium oxysporum]|nr:hypothetical protein QWA68_016853 [Fusarium oxysporum]